MQIENVGKGWVMFGDDSNGKWFERWFATKEKAIAHAHKKGWTWTVK